MPACPLLKCTNPRGKSCAKCSKPTKIKKTTGTPCGGPKQVLNYKCKQNMTKAHICPIIRFGRLYIGPVKTGTMGVSIRFATGKGG